MKTGPKLLTLVLDLNSHERAYLDGIDTGIPRDETLYAGDIEEAAGGEAVIIEQIAVDFRFDSWPRLLSDVRSPSPLRAPKAVKRKKPDA